MQKSSRLSGFYQLGQDERLDLVKTHCALDDATIDALKTRVPCLLILSIVWSKMPSVGLPFRLALQPI